MNLGHVCDETWSYSTLISPINFGMLPLRPPFRFILTHWIQCTLLLLGRLFCFIFAVVITILGPKQLRRKGFVSVHSFRFQSVVVGKSRQGLQTSHPWLENNDYGHAHLLSCAPLPREWRHPQWAGSSQIYYTNQNNAPQTWPTQCWQSLTETLFLDAIRSRQVEN